MSFFDELKRLARPYEDEDEDMYEEDFAPVGTAKDAPRDRDRDRDRDADRRSNKVVNIHTTTQLQVVLVSPTRFENASEIADHLRDKRTVVLNLEQTDKNIARRLIDFLSGVAYANEGTIKKVALSTYIITPYNVEILGDLIDELENNGLYF
jgi:cell division inhibitor SepF